MAGPAEVESAGLDKVADQDKVQEALADQGKVQEAGQDMVLAHPDQDMVREVDQDNHHRRAVEVAEDEAEQEQSKEESYC